METTNPHTRDTTKARQARSASAARRRHERWINELKAAGVAVEVPEEYTGLPLAAEQ